MNIHNIPIEKIKPYGRNPRKNDQAVDAVAASIQEFGFRVPLLIDKNNVIVAGHTLKTGYEVVIIPLTTFVTKKVLAAEESIA